ncbi:hypothetical protein ACQ86N_13005 [Puia sp. P3]|uniref:hypothetical protein n=1 Tax=Puia sp. P3 TaxID=3423952 RepID=UPI003D67808E
MRRKSRYMSTCAVFGGALLFANDFVNQRTTCHDNGVELTLDNYDWGRGLKSSLAGATIGAGLGWVYYQYLRYEEAKFPFDPDTYLEAVLLKEHLKSDPGFLRQLLEIRDRVSAKLKSIFGDDLMENPIVAGSFRKRTAILSGSDLDIILVFSKNACGTLEEMYEYAYDRIRAEFSEKAIVTKQRRSIGLTFDSGEDSIYVDIIPGRAIGDYPRDRRLNLYVRPEWFWQRGSSMKVNIKQQLAITRNLPAARKIIKLLKIYRERFAPALPSAVIEQCTVQALSQYGWGISPSIAENLLNAMESLARKLRQTAQWDMGNSNNNLNKKMSSWERNAIANRLDSDLEAVDEDERYLIEIFE